MAELPQGPTRRQWEEEMLAEFLAARFPACLTMNRVRLGPTTTTDPDPTLTEAERRLLGASFRRWADAACVDQGRLVLIEAAMIPDPRDISLLETYLLLVDSTPELERWRGLPRQGLLVWAVDDAFSRTLAARRGLAVEIFRPRNFGEWLSVKREQERRKTRPAVTKRDGGP